MSGVTKHVAPDSITDLDDRKAWEDERAEKDKLAVRFETSLLDHTPLPGATKEVTTPAWTSKIVGDVQPFTLVAPKEGTVSYGVNVLRSQRWPGAVTVSKGGKFTSIYVGYGLKRGGTTQMPSAPEEVIADPPEPTEQPEPTPLTEPEAPPQENLENQS